MKKTLSLKAHQMNETKTPMETQQTALAPYLRVKYLMKTIGMNQSQLAEEMGVTRAAVSAWLNRDADRRSEIARSSIIKMSDILKVNPEWITGESTDGGPELNGAIVDSLTTQQTPSSTSFMSDVKKLVLDEQPNFDKGFDFPFLITVGHDYEPIKFDFDFIDSRIALIVDIYRNKTPRNSDTLPHLLWNFQMAKRLDEMNGAEKRRYQLVLIHPQASEKERDDASSFAHQARMLGIEVAIRDSEDVKSIANLIIDPKFKDGSKRWPKELLDYQASFRST